MTKDDHLSKAAIYLTGALITALLGAQVTLTFKMLDSTIGAKEQLAIVSTQMNAVIGNQRLLRNDFGVMKLDFSAITNKVNLLCYQQKLLFPDKHKHDC